MRFRSGRRGYTLIEVVLATSIMGFIGAGALALAVGSMRCFDDTSVACFTDTDAVIAMQRMVADVREAKNVTISPDGETLQEMFPKVTEDGHYDRHEIDPNETITYYLSDGTGSSDHSGVWLWRSEHDGSQEVIKRDVTELSFEQDTSRSLKITLTVRNVAASGPRETTLTERVVYMRNY